MEASTQAAEAATEEACSSGPESRSGAVVAQLVDQSLMISVDVESDGLIPTRAKLLLGPKAVDIVALAATEEATQYAKDIIKDLTPEGHGEGRGGVRSHAGQTHLRTAEQTHLRTAWASRVGAVGPEYVGHIFNPKPYAKAVEEGRAPTTIYVKRKRFLWWPSIINARMKSVPWPGFTGRHMARTGLNAARAGIFNIYSRAVDAAIRRIFG